MVTGRLARRLYEHPELGPRFLATLEEMVDTHWDEATLLAEVDRMESLITPLLSAEERPATLDAIEAKRTFIEGRRAAIAAEIAMGPLSTLAPERDEICASVVGTVTGSFSTTWDTLAVEDLFTTGTGTINATVEEAMPAITPVGAKIGLGTEAEQRGRAVLTLAGVIDPATVLVAFVVTDVDNITPGILALDWVEVEASLYLFNPMTGGVFPFGFLVDGTLELTEASTVDPSPVVGTFEASIFQL